MQFYSTRGRTGPATFIHAMLRGLATDGGLYTPDRSDIEVLPQETWRSADSFADLAARVLAPSLEREIPDLDTLLTEALSFPVPLVRVGRMHVLELFHGPTLSFKDFGARTMARLMNRVVHHAPRTILVATSGDTGSAVADGFSGQSNLRVAVLYPEGQVSPLQERQLIARRPGVRAYAVAGSFDDCQAMVKSILGTPGSLTLSSANSINVGRLLPQMTYYFWALAQRECATANVCVPSGNLGNLTAAVLARLAGAPIGQFMAAHNANDGFPRYLSGDPEGFGASVQTLSNAMDVGLPSNFERLRYLLTESELRSWVKGHAVSDQTTLEVMCEVYETTGYVCDPHTAVGIAAAQALEDPAIVAATAHPAKFPETVFRALGHRPLRVPALEALKSMPTRVEPLEASAHALRSALEAW